MIEPAPGSARPRLNRRRWLITAVVIATIGWAAVGGWRDRAKRRVRPIDSASGYINTALDVGYVGDQACARCHGEIAALYRRHPMGRSLMPISMDRDAAPGKSALGDQVVFKASGLEYSVADRDGRVFHQESRRDASSRAVARAEGEVRFVLGSGRIGLSFLIERDGFLFQSPISWYTQKAKWDLSPGYERRNAHFDRPIGASCLYCHANHVNPTRGTVNHYETPIFQGHAIGCERCHGPGEEHAVRPMIVDGRDVTIVNPANLEPPLRDAVCEQCHLSGRRRIPRLGKTDQDFRPGLAFHSFWTVFEPAEGSNGERFVGQVEQMRESRCHAASQGKLGCTSCHDPHRVPEPDERTAYYRERCLNCHAKKPCALERTTRLKQSPADDCVSCHMPRQGSHDIAHSAATDHRVPRFPGREQAAIPISPSPGSSLVPFHAALLTDQERSSIGRDLGISVCREGIEGATLAVSKLEQALKTNHNDPVGWEALAIALDELGRNADALAAWKEALALPPTSETALAGLAAAAQAAGQRDLAVSTWRKTLAAAPVRSEYRANLASALFETRDWPGCARECRAALGLNPADLDTRQLLVRCLLRLGDQAAAREQFHILLDFDPPDRADLRNRFSALTPKP